MTRQSLTDWRRERNAELERRVEMLSAERERLEVLLATALRVAVGGTNVSPLTLLEVIAASEGIELSRPAWVVKRERVRYERAAVNAYRVLVEVSDTRPEAVAA